LHELFLFVQLHYLFQIHIEYKRLKGTKNKLKKEFAWIIFICSIAFY